MLKIRSMSYSIQHKSNGGRANWICSTSSSGTSRSTVATRALASLSNTNFSASRVLCCVSRTIRGISGYDSLAARKRSAIVGSRIDDHHDPAAFATVDHDADKVLPQAEAFDDVLFSGRLGGVPAQGSCPGV